jgi:hypothetical protein
METPSRLAMGESAPVTIASRRRRSPRLSTMATLAASSLRRATRCRGSQAAERGMVQRLLSQIVVYRYKMTPPSFCIGDQLINLLISWMVCNVHLVICFVNADDTRHRVDRHGSHDGFSVIDG